MLPMLPEGKYFLISIFQGKGKEEERKHLENNMILNFSTCAKVGEVLMVNHFLYNQPTGSLSTDGVTNGQLIMGEPFIILKNYPNSRVSEIMQTCNGETIMGYNRFHLELNEPTIEGHIRFDPRPYMTRYQMFRID